jgi:hypothetical protein
MLRDIVGVALDGACDVRRFRRAAGFGGGRQDRVMGRDGSRTARSGAVFDVDIAVAT